MQEPDYDQATEVLPAKEENDKWWPAMMALLQQCLPGTTVELSYTRPGWKEPVAVKLTPVEAADWFNPDRGFLFEPMTFDLRANSVGDAVALGGRETLEALTIVFRTVQKLSTNQVSLRLIAGPWTILTVALALRRPGERPAAAVSDALEREPGGAQFPAHSAAWTAGTSCSCATKGSAANRPPRACRSC